MSTGTRAREVEPAARDRAVRKQVPIAPITPGTDTDRVGRVLAAIRRCPRNTRPLDCQQELREPSLHATRERCVDPLVEPSPLRDCYLENVQLLLSRLLVLNSADFSFSLPHFLWKI